MGKVIEIAKHKSDKKTKKILEDIQEVNKIMAISIKALSFYKKYTPVRKVISSLYDNKINIEIAIKKLKDELENAKE